LGEARGMGKADEKKTWLQKKKRAETLRIANISGENGGQKQLDLGGTEGKTGKGGAKKKKNSPLSAKKEGSGKKNLSQEKSSSKEKESGLRRGAPSSQT